MQPGLVSIMMPAYNAEKFIAEAIESVLTQTYQQWELLVVNDGSTDNTAAVVAGFTDPRLKLIEKENGGEASARNLALEHSQGEFIAYLDADDAYLPHHLAATVTYLQRHPDRDAVYTDGYHVDQAGNRLKSLSSRRRGPFEGRLFEPLVLASDVFGPPLCVVLRHELVAEHRLRYDPRIVIGPDWDFFIRYADLAQFGYMADQTCLYRVHLTNITSQVDVPRRVGYLALCREKAIKMENFKSCSAETRTAVFYELLINLLHGQPERQAAVTEWPEFADLPQHEQARLYRLLASKAVLKGGKYPHIDVWLARSQALTPGDRRAALLVRLYRANPWLCQQLLRVKNLVQPDFVPASPLADVFQ